jgi:hypothetical protein
VVVELAGGVKEREREEEVDTVHSPSDGRIGFFFPTWSLDRNRNFFSLLWQTQIGAIQTFISIMSYTNWHTTGI